MTIPFVHSRPLSFSGTDARQLHSVSMLLLARLLLNLREAVDQPGSTTESSGFLDTLHSSSRHMSLMLVNEIARDDTALTGIRGSTRRYDMLAGGSTESLEPFTMYEDDSEPRPRIN